jgi:cholesterol oxidase
MAGSNAPARRTVLQGAGAALGALSVGGPAWAQRGDYSPAIVVGSGFGGAVAALRLGEAGVDTLVLERGRRWPIRADGDTFATFERPDGRAHWLRERTAEDLFGLPQLVKPIDRYIGVLEVVAGDGMSIGAGAGVGGGSLVYNAIIVPPRREMFERVFAHAIDFGEMADVYYPRVRAMIGASPMPDDILATDYYLSSRVSFDQARAAGFATRPVELGVDWSVVREEIAGARRASAIAGQCWFGLNSGAKRSLDGNYLARAEASGHVDVLAQHQVVRIERAERGRYAVIAQRLSDDGAADGPARRFVCSRLFLAGGSLGTTSLLVRAKATRALPHLNEHVGRHWAANGDIAVTRGALPRTNAATGGPGGHFILDDLDNPSGPTSLVEIVLAPHLAAALAASGAPAHFALYASLGLPPAIGWFDYDRSRDEVSLHWPGDDPRLANFLAAARHTTDALDRANGSATLGLNTALSAHPLGGAVLGKACRMNGELKGCPGLYAIDGSLIEGAAGLVNPALTIAALAERCMDRIIGHGGLDRRGG